jgi:hypothetical protein
MLLPSITPDIRLAASELRSLSEPRRRGDDGWLQDSPDFCLVDGGINEPRWLFDPETHRGLGVQVPAFPASRHPFHEERTTAQVGGVTFILRLFGL